MPAAPDAGWPASLATTAVAIAAQCSTSVIAAMSCAAAPPPAARTGQARIGATAASPYSGRVRQSSNRRRRRQPIMAVFIRKFAGRRKEMADLGAQDFASGDRYADRALPGHRPAGPFDSVGKSPKAARSARRALKFSLGRPLETHVRTPQKRREY